MFTVSPGIFGLGASTTIWFGGLTVTEDAGTCPNETVASASKPVPTIATEVPAGPSLGLAWATSRGWGPP